MSTSENAPCRRGSTATSAPTRSRARGDDLSCASSSAIRSLSLPTVPGSMPGLVGELRGVGQVAVVAEGEVDAAGVAEHGLGVAPGAGAGRRVAGVADGHVAGEAAERPLVEDVGDQAHVLDDRDRPAVGHGDAGRLLAAVLQGVEPEVGQVGDRLAGGVHAEDAARLLRRVVVFLAGRAGFRRPPYRPGRRRPGSAPGQCGRPPLTFGTSRGASTTTRVTSGRGPRPARGPRSPCPRGRHAETAGSQWAAGRAHGARPAAPRLRPRSPPFPAALRPAVWPMSLPARDLQSGGATPDRRTGMRERGSPRRRRAARAAPARAGDPTGAVVPLRSGLAPSPNPVESALLASARGDATAFATLYDLCSAAVYGLIRRIRATAPSPTR